MAKAKSKKWIDKAIKKPGALHKELGVPAGKKIPEAKLEKASKAPGKLGKRAHLAQTLKGFKHEKGESKRTERMENIKKKLSKSKKK